MSFNTPVITRSVEQGLHCSDACTQGKYKEFIGMYLYVKNECEL